MASMIYAASFGMMGHPERESEGTSFAIESWGPEGTLKKQPPSLETPQEPRSFFITSMRRAPRRAESHEDVAAGPRRSSRGLPGSRGSTRTARGVARTRWAAVHRGGTAEYGHPPEARQATLI